MRTAACIAAALVLLLARAAAAEGTVQSRFFVTSDGVRLHYLEAGPRLAHTIVFVPGWTMPAWIWQPQLQAFAQRYHVVAFDPRGQGDQPFHVVRTPGCTAPCQRLSLHGFFMPRGNNSR